MPSMTPELNHQLTITIYTILAIIACIIWILNNHRPR